MNSPVSLSSMFQTVGLVYGWTMPVLVLVGIALLFIATARDNARPHLQVRVIYCHLAQTLGILLMTAGALPAIYAVFAPQPLDQMTYLGLLLVFCIGGLTYLIHDTSLRAIDRATRAVADAIFFHIWKLTGLLIILFTGLSLALRYMMDMQNAHEWRVMHLTMLLYGLVLCIFTLHRDPPATPVRPVPAPRPVMVAKKPTKAKAIGKKG